MRRFLFAVGVGCLVAVGRLPARRRVGAALGRFFFLVAGRRRRVAMVNLRLAMPALPEATREDIVRRHFAAMGEWVMDNLWALSASREEVRGYFRLEGEFPDSCIIMVPHFLGLEVALLRINMALPHPAAFHYKPMHSGFWDAVLQRLRQRFGGVGFSTASKHALLAAVRHCREGGFLCYLPDIDPRGRKSTVYVPFMAVEETATTTGLSRLAKAGRTPVVPYIICREAEGYIGRVLPPLDDFPSGDDTADAARINALIGEWVERMPENYYWMHRRFKTDAKGRTAHYD